MTEPDCHALARHAADFLGLAIEPSMLEGVAANLALLHRHAAEVMAFALADEEEIAPVFHP